MLYVPGLKLWGTTIVVGSFGVDAIMQFFQLLQEAG
jgi:hypothetical protein